MVQIENIVPKPRPVMGKAIVEAEAISKDDLLLAQIAENMQSEETVEDVLNSDAAREIGYKRQSSEHAVNIRHVRPGKIIMFKPDEYGRYTRKLIPAKRMFENMKDGWLTVCPACHTDCNPNPNKCEARVKAKAFLKNTRCPTCRKPFYDPGEQPNSRNTDEKDPGSVDFDDFDDTPESRVKAMRDDHIRASHPTIARRMGLFAPQIVGEKDAA